MKKDPFRPAFLDMISSMQRMMEEQNKLQKLKGISALQFSISEVVKSFDTMKQPYAAMNDAILGGSTISSMIKQFSFYDEYKKANDPISGLRSIGLSPAAVNVQDYVRDHFKAYNTHLKLNSSIADFLKADAGIRSFITPVNFVNNSPLNPFDILSGKTFIDSFELLRSTESSFDDEDYMSQVAEAQRVISENPEIMVEIANEIETLKSADMPWTDWMESVSKQIPNKIYNIFSAALSKIGIHDETFKRWLFAGIIGMWILMTQLPSEIIGSEITTDDSNQEHGNLVLTVEQNITVNEVENHDTQSMKFYLTDQFEVYDKCNGVYILCLEKGSCIRILDTQNEWTHVEYFEDEQPENGWIKDISIVTGNKRN